MGTFFAAVLGIDVWDLVSALSRIWIRKLRLKLHLVDPSLVHIALNIEDTNSPDQPIGCLTMDSHRKEREGKKLRKEIKEIQLA